ncbi:MAG: hypothetical protein JWN95_1309 [Frankiales bacterium]|nr:hypothetical protein [Frankiales bacterium]
MKRTLADELHSTLLERSLQAPGPADTIAAVLARTAELSIEPIEPIDSLDSGGGDSGRDWDSGDRDSGRDWDSGDRDSGRDRDFGDRDSAAPRSRGRRLVSSLRRRPLYALVGVAAALAIGNGVVLLQSHHDDGQNSAATSAGAAGSSGDLQGQAPAVGSPPAAGEAAGIANCTAADLGGTAPAQLQSRPAGATITITNRGRVACAIRGLAVLTPEIGGQPVHSPSPASSAFQAPVVPAVVVLAPGSSASAPVTAVGKAADASDGGCAISDHLRIELPNIAAPVVAPARLPSCGLRVGPFAQ